MEKEFKWYFGLRQIFPKPPATAIPCGPYDTNEEAFQARQKAKSPDCRVSAPFASTKEDALEKAEFNTP